MRERAGDKRGTNCPYLRQSFCNQEDSFSQHSSSLPPSSQKLGTLTISSASNREPRDFRWTKKLRRERLLAEGSAEEAKERKDDAARGDGPRDDEARHGADEKYGRFLP